MKNIQSKIRSFYQDIITSIGFYPALIASLFLVFYFFISYFELSEAGRAVKDTFSGIKLESEQTARTILATIVGGIISLTVFSFSMVMVVLSQTSSTFSPKVLRGLISYKSHQFVLGVYIGTLIYSMLLLLEIRKDGDAFDIPSTGIFIAILLAVFCLGLFVYFVHSISESIQIGNIIRNIHTDTRKEIEKRQSSYQNKYYRDIEIDEKDHTWFVYAVNKYEYYQSFNADRLLKAARAHDVIVRIECFRGDFLLSHLPLFSLTKNLTSAKDGLKDIYSTFSFYEGEFVNSNPHFGYSQLMEIAIKALSPGINDPGSAILCINRLTDLLCSRMEGKKEINYFDEQGALRIIDKPHGFEKLLFTTFPPIRHYGKGDRDIVVALLQSIYKLSLKDTKQEHQHSLQSEAEATIEEARHNLHNGQSLAYINHIINYMNQSRYFHLPLLEIAAEG